MQPTGARGTLTVRLKWDDHSDEENHPTRRVFEREEAGV